MAIFGLLNAHNFAPNGPNIANDPIFSSTLSALPIFTNQIFHLETIKIPLSKEGPLTVQKNHSGM